METATGRITVVQDDRFLLTTDAGQGFLLTLGRNASNDAGDLREFLASGARVTVEYDGRPSLASAVAHKVRAVN